MRAKLTFIHISDTHIGPTQDFELHGQNSYRHLERLVQIVNDLPQPPDFVLHTGDLSTDQSPASYELAREILAGWTVPVYYVGGNHDDRALLRAQMGAPAHPSGDPLAPLDYTFEVKGERFLVLDAHSVEVADPSGCLDDDQLECVRAEAQPGGPPLTVCLHYPLFRMASPWLDAHMLVVNGEALHAALVPARARLRGVFYGHMHRSCQVTRDGITYTCAASSVSQYAWRPWDTLPQVDDDFLPGYNVVQYLDHQTIVHQYNFARP